jgi:hypothetical protein
LIGAKPIGVECRRKVIDIAACRGACAKQPLRHLIHVEQLSLRIKDADANRQRI